MFAETYCMNRPTHLAGALCHNRIPLGEKLCDDCKPKPQGFQAPEDRKTVGGSAA
jgi:hypothetical protein